MKRIFLRSNGPEAWRQFLRSPEKQWKTGFSAKSMAYAWEETEGFPMEVDNVFEGTLFEGVEPLFIIPEYPVPLPGGTQPSVNDVFVLAKTEAELICMMVEGKVSENFGEMIEAWNPESTPGRRERFDHILNLLGLGNDIPLTLRYQLFHRTASAVVEAQNLKVTKAVMLVHSFSQERQHFGDYQDFLKLFSVEAKINQLQFVGNFSGIDLYSGWVVGDKKYLSV